MIFTGSDDTAVDEETKKASSSGVDVALPLQVLQDAPLAIAVVEGPEHRYLFANEAYCALSTGKGSAGKASLVGHTLREVFPEATGRGTAFIDEVYATGRPVRLRRQKIRAIPGRETSVWNVDLLPVRSEDGGIGGVLLVLDDVSDVAAAAGQATASEAAEAGAAAQRILEGVMRHMPECMATSASGDAGVCSNRTARAEWEVPQPGYLEEHSWRFRRRDGTIASPDELPLTRAITTGEVVPVEELVLERPDGERFHILCNAGPIRDHAGNVSGGIVVCRDVSALRRLEDALRASEDSLQLALESADMGTWDLDLVANTARRSLRHDEIFGYPKPLPEWGRETFMVHVVADDQTAVAAAFDAALEQGTLEFECRICRTDGGEIRWIAGRGRTYYDSFGTPIRIAGIIQDITERKNADLLMRQAREKIEHFKKAARDEILARYERMTPRQRDVLGLVVSGLSNKEIAHRLGISERTVEVHRGWVMEKMKARSIADLVRMAASIGIEPDVPPPQTAQTATKQGR
jgi:PAS domain S-box-containing protein